MLLTSAERRLYRPLWTSQILDELEGALVRDKIMIPESANYRRCEMEAAFSEAQVLGYESLIHAMTNDEKDRHVVAAAVRGSAQVIVTANKRHFPEEALRPFGITAYTPDEFLNDLLGFEPKPPMSDPELLRRIGKNAENFAASVLMLLEGGSGGA